MYELETRFGTIASDPVDLVRQLIRKLERTPVYTSLVSVLHNLATVRQLSNSYSLYLRSYYYLNPPNMNVHYHCS